MPKVSNRNTRRRLQPRPKPNIKTNNWYLYIHIYINIHTHIRTYTQIYTYIDTYAHIYTYTYITANPEHTTYTAAAPPSPTPNMQLPSGYLQLRLIFKSYQNAISNGNIQRNDIMKKCFTHCTIDVMSLVILICNEKLLSSCPTESKMNKKSFSQS